MIGGEGLLTKRRIEMELCHSKITVVEFVCSIINL